MTLDPTTTSRLRAAFPSRLSADVHAALDRLEPARPAPSSRDVGSLTVGGEALHIPMRVYFPVPSTSARAALSAVQRTILGSLLTRHHDGHVRERACAELLASREVWVTPFVVQLVGEYVVEIVELVARHAEVLGEPSYRSFSAENPRFLRLVRARATSYWDCYHRSKWPQKDRYPAFALLDLLEAR